MPQIPELDPNRTYTAKEVLEIAIRAGQHAGHRAALDADAIRADKAEPLFLTEERVKEIIREEARIAVETAHDRSVRDTKLLFRTVGLAVDDDKIDDTRERLRLALSFPSNAKSFAKWLGATIGGAVLTTIAAFVMAALRWSPGGGK